MWWKTSDSPEESGESDREDEEYLRKLIRSRSAVETGGFPWDHRSKAPVNTGVPRVPFMAPPGPYRHIKEHEMPLLEERLTRVNDKISELSEGLKAWENQHELDRLESLRDYLHHRIADHREDAAAIEREAEERSILEQPGFGQSDDGNTESSGPGGDDYIQGDLESWDDECLPETGAEADGGSPDWY